MKNDAYVYQHKTLDNKVFYVGMSTDNKDGKYKRLNSKARTSKWKDFIKDKEYKVEIVKENLSAGEAIDLEAQLIETYKRGGELTNIRDTNKVEENFFYVFKDTTILFKSLTLLPSKLIMALCSLSDYNRNSLILTKEVRNKLKDLISMSDTALCLSLRILKEMDIITKENNLITINNKYFWKGDLEKLERLTNS